ncbi:MAG TPA: hypothetical protein VFY68_02395 [Nitrososphaeraceae archaeon]|jgi:hypothetical protein|nr:hypothetical protein [Nitrososphaeraceae archaeon]
MRASHDKISSIVSSLEIAFEVDQVEATVYLSTEFLKNPIDRLLTRKIYVQQIKELLTIIIPIATVIVTIVDIFIID